MKKKNWLIVGILAVVTFLLGMLANSIMGRKAEAQIISRANTDIKDFEARNEIWGEYYQREYQSWLQTADTTFRAKYMSSDNDDLLAERPEMVILWAGYAFSKDYTAPRGHMHAVADVTHTLRTGSPTDSTHSPQPSTCWTCKSPDVPRMMNKIGIENYYKGHWDELGNEIVNPIGCANCHDPKTMNLTITQPALVEAFNRQGKDITKATHQEMRSLVCAQCHVEYYFKKESNYLTFPWDHGKKVEDVEKFYDNVGWTDFVHKVSRTPILKAQHPDYEIFQLGIHAQRGVSCSDCHMPYKTEGGVKYTDHHISSPLRNVNASCQVCHRQPEEELIKNVYERQDYVFTLRNRLEKQLAKVHFQAKFLWDNGATEEQMKPILDLIRKSQWRWDFITASHGAAFHAPIESQKVLGDGMFYAMQAESDMNGLTDKLKITAKFEMPDISTKAKAQSIIGLDMEKEEANKKQFMKTIVPKWIKEAKEKGNLVTQK
ncbi:ammonia-forming cytochrome c nitrite reductase [Capnocytophaga cynodegmi]|uniref:nitrite reductase (cytochrome; ammonia-forming) n=1 Tax=Capnocytophaga cynodegmi TaxID=28189 RepID=A0A0B7HXD6_9FLAO|nr:ammonia-forming cytochrome c nitrite reductase [Capnocytophaga cynodegmi]CEN36874.1 Cytochrome c-552 [Capnocytophaga cynodegmi]CEN42178.1 Cytochrome c-552 [Capnocytophaga cynodegmi]